MREDSKRPSAFVALTVPVDGRCVCCSEYTPVGHLHVEQDMPLCSACGDVARTVVASAAGAQVRSLLAARAYVRKLLGWSSPGAAPVTDVK